MANVTKAAKNAVKNTARRAAQKQAKNISANLADTLEESIIKRRSGIEEAFSKGVEQVLQKMQCIFQRIHKYYKTMLIML